MLHRPIPLLQSTSSMGRLSCLTLVYEGGSGESTMLGVLSTSSSGKMDWLVSRGRSSSLLPRLNKKSSGDWYWISSLPIMINRLADWNTFIMIWLWVIIHPYYGTKILKQNYLIIYIKSVFMTFNYLWHFNKWIHYNQEYYVAHQQRYLLRPALWYCFQTLRCWGGVHSLPGLITVNNNTN